MIRLRRASVIATLSLLVWAATAYAECAWVLCDGKVAVPLEWQIHSAYPTAKECGEDLTLLVQFYQNRGYQAAVAGRTAAYKKENERGYLKCLPDTVDPRGPKGT